MCLLSLCSPHGLTPTTGGCRSVSLRPGAPPCLQVDLPAGRILFPARTDPPSITIPGFTSSHLEHLPVSWQIMPGLLQGKAQDLRAILQRLGSGPCRRCSSNSGGSFQGILQERQPWPLVSCQASPSEWETAPAPGLSPTCPHRWPSGGDLGAAAAVPGEQDLLRGVQVPEGRRGQEVGAILGLG